MECEEQEKMISKRQSFLDGQVEKLLTRRIKLAFCCQTATKHNHWKTESSLSRWRSKSSKLSTARDHRTDNRIDFLTLSPSKDEYAQRSLYQANDDRRGTRLHSSSAFHLTSQVLVNTTEAPPTSISRDVQTARQSSFNTSLTKTSGYHRSFTRRPPIATGAPNYPLTTANPKGINLAGLFNYPPSSTRNPAALSTSKPGSRGGFLGLHL